MANERSRNRTERGKAVATTRRWSQEVTTKSNALDLEPGVFRQQSPRGIAESLRRSALASQRRKSSAEQSAMSMLTFYINRAGRNLNPEQREILERAKEELRRLNTGARRRQK
jgi:hypothetical protein